MSEDYEAASAARRVKREYMRKRRADPAERARHAAEEGRRYRKKRLDPDFMEKKRVAERARFAADPEYHLAQGRKRQRAYTARHANWVRNLWRRAKERAKQKNLPFELAWEDITVPTTCPILGIALLHATGNLAAHSPSLDRIIPALGYVKSNVRVISARANRLKCDGTATEMKLIYEDLLRIESGG